MDNFIKRSIQSKNHQNGFNSLISNVFSPKIPKIFQRKTGNKHNLLDLGNCRGLNVWSVTCVLLLLCADAFGLTHTSSHSSP